MGAPSVTPVPIRVPITTVPVVAARRAIAVTFSVPIPVPVMVITVAFTIPVISTIRVAPGPTMAHVLSGGRSMGSVSNREVDADTAAIQFNTVQLFNAASSLVYGRHGDESKSTRTPRPLIVDNQNFLDASKPAEFVIQVPLGATDAEAENTEDTRWVRGDLTRALVTRWTMTTRRTARS